MRTRSTSSRRLATELHVTTTIGIPPKQKAVGLPDPRAGRAPADVPGRAGHWLRAAVPLRADDDRGEGALRLGVVPAEPRAARLRTWSRSSARCRSGRR